MSAEQVPPSCHQSSNDVSRPEFLLKSFFKNAWQKSIAFAEKLLNLSAISSKSQINLQTQPQQRTTPTQQFLREIKRKRGKTQEFQNTQKIRMDSSHHYDSPQTFLQVNSSLQTDNKNQGFKLSKKRTQLGTMILLIQGQKGRFNMSEVFKKLKNQKEQKTHKQTLKISRSQFTPFHTHEANTELQGKTLKQIFLPKSQQNKLKQKDEKKVQVSLEQNQKSLTKSPIKGVINSSEEKMINEGSPIPILFRGDLSTILQSSNEDISRDKQIDKGFIIFDNVKQELKNECLKDVREQKQVKQKSNPFLISTKKDSSSDQEGKGDVIETMRKKLFNTAFGANGAQMSKGEEKIQVAGDYKVNLNFFANRNFFDNQITNISSKSSTTCFLGSAFPQEIKSPINTPCIAQSFHPSNIQKTQEHLGSNHLKDSLQRQQGLIMNGSFYNNQVAGRFMNSFQSNVTLNPINGQSTSIAKQILNTFIQPQKTIQTQSFFDQKEEKQSESKKTDRKMKKRGKKEERIRG